MGTSVLRYKYAYGYLIDQSEAAYLFCWVLIYLSIFIYSIYGVQNQKPNDEMQNSQRPYIKADNWSY